MTVETASSMRGITNSSMMPWTSSSSSVLYVGAPIKFRTMINSSTDPLDVSVMVCSIPFCIHHRSLPRPLVLTRGPGQSGVESEGPARWRG